MVVLVVNWQFIQYSAWDGSCTVNILPICVEYVSLDHSFVEVNNYVNG